MKCCSANQTMPHGTLLHGRFMIHILDGKDFSNATFEAFETAIRPYIEIKVGCRIVTATKQSEGSNPTWDAKLDVNLCDRADEIMLYINDDDDVLGSIAINAQDLLRIPCRELKWEEVPNRGSLRYGYEFIEVSKMVPSMEVPNTYFSMTTGNKVTPFLCATCPKNHLPEINIEAGAGVFEVESYFDDLHDKINAAKVLIYMTGWSVWVNLILSRTRGADEETLGKLLTRKSEEGVRVCVMVWNDQTSRTGWAGKVEKWFGYKSGLMGTHDEETFTFFKNTKVFCANVPRPYGSARWEGQYIFTHHQKSVILDHDGRLIAYVGGIDLCDGRWDTPDHPLFGTLQTFHKDDFHQCMVSGATNKTGPREPWQDLHARLEGPIARHVCQNFEERWMQTASLSEMKDESQNTEDALLDIQSTNLWCGAVQNENCCDQWNVQLFRSIDTHCAALLQNPALEYSVEVHESGEVLYDRSIQNAYVHHIRCAKRFIYIENQYFLGSSHLWSISQSDSIVPMCTNLIPAELAFKIASKIRAYEPFHVYITIPMWPEGIPSAGAIQEILCSQHKTVEMMYTIVAKAIEEAGTQHHPRDFLSFYCLVKREVHRDESEPPRGFNNDLTSMWKGARAPIYIHSKYMNVDDQWMIMGSANINQRSMDGERDTEIAYGAYQPEFVSDDDICPQGVVQGFRLHLLASHLGIRDAGDLDQFREFHTGRVTDEFKRRAEANWRDYISVAPTAMTGQIVPYPYKVSTDGKVVGWSIKPKQRSGGTFPDTSARICGTFGRTPNVIST